MDKTNQHLSSRILSFKYAFEGLKAAISEEPNLKIHLLIGVLVIFAGFYFNISKLNWIIIVILIGLVISVELTNTAIEAVVDYCIQQQHNGAKMAKDISAAAVLVVSITAAVIGLIIFLPYLGVSII